MDVFLNVYRRLDRTQQTLWFRLAATCLLMALCGAVFSALLLKSYSLASQRHDLTTALSGQNLNDGDALAVSLERRGEIVVNERRYGGEEFRNPRIPLFDQQGNIANVALLVDALLAEQRPAWAPDWLLDDPSTTTLLAIVTPLWLLLVVWMKITLPLMLTLLGTAVPVVICRWLGSPQGMLAFAGIGVLTFTFVLLTRAVLLLLHHAYQVLAVAHTVVKEASRIRISLVFIVLLLIALPILPITLDPEAPLRFRIQTFISRSLGLTFFIAAVMTLFFSCATVAFEIRDRQIWQLVTKPLSRLYYLVGKWLGVVLVDFCVLLVAGVSTFTFIQYLKQQPVARGDAGALDALAVRDEVLTARVGAQPQYDQLTAEQLRERVNQIIQNTPEYAALEEIPVSLRVRLQRELEQAHSLGQRTVPPGSVRHYVFSGLTPAKALNSTLTLRYRFHILRDDDHQTFDALFVFNEDFEQQRFSRYVPTIPHSFPIGAHLIRDDGTLKVSIVNLYQGQHETRGVGAINFEEEDFELLYKVDTFESNFFRAVLITWLKLAFLAALGVGSATLLSFPVACLLSFTVFISGMLGPFLAEALEWYYPMETSQVDWSDVGMVMMWAFDWVIRGIALLIVFLLSSFGELRPTQTLVEGRLIEWYSVLMEFLKLGLLWSGLAMMLGYLVLRHRQLAIYSGHG